MLKNSIHSQSKQASKEEIQTKCERALAFHQKGQFIQAQALYLDVLNHNPKHPDALHLLGLVAYQQNKLPEAIDLISQAINLTANNPVFYLSKGNALLAYDKPLAAIECYSSAISLKKDYVKAYCNLGAALRETKQFEKAIKSYTQAIALKPDYIDALLNRGNAFQDTSQFNLAIKDYDKVIALKPDLARAHYNRANALKELNIYQDAIAGYNQAIQFKTDFAEAYNNIGLMLNEIGNHEKAIQYLTLAEQLKAVNFRKSYLLDSIYRIRDKKHFNNTVKKLTPTDHKDPLIASILSHAAIKYSQQDLNQFCPHAMDFVHLSEVKDQEGLSDSIINQSVAYLHGNNSQTRNQPLLKNGVQTAGNLFNCNLKFVADLKNIITHKVEEYREKHKDSQCTLIQNWPQEYVIYGWLVGMQDGGELSPHIHGNAWLSGCLYLVMPDKNKPNAGDIKFGLDGGKYETGGAMFPSKIIAPKVRDILLFPSSLFHSTIPFSGIKHRVSLAFDIRPVALNR